ncbi:hypothetical protein QBC43DRAFT_288541 [Cladorrhinum sp. PSN259]|nr:hypothetical protein QBC43DRAFT_288541 [Cladorrhinum sp. PSN259]
MRFSFPIVTLLFAITNGQNNKTNTGSDLPRGLCSTPTYHNATTLDGPPVAACFGLIDSINPYQKWDAADLSQDQGGLNFSDCYITFKALIPDGGRAPEPEHGSKSLHPVFINGVDLREVIRKSIELFNRTDADGVARVGSYGVMFCDDSRNRTNEVAYNLY